MKTYKEIKRFLVILCIIMCNSCTSHNLYSTKSYISCSVALLNNEFSSTVSFQNKILLTDIDDDFCILPVSQGIADIKNGANFKLVRIISKDNYYLIGNTSNDIQIEDNVLLPSYYDSTLSNIKNYFGIADNQINYSYTTFESIMLYLGNLTASNSLVSNDSTNVFTVMPEPFASRTIQNVSNFKILKKLEANEYFGLFINNKVTDDSSLNNYLKLIDDTLADLVIKDSKDVRINLIKNGETSNLENYGLSYELLQNLQIGIDDEGNTKILNKLCYVYPNPEIDAIKTTYPDLSDELVHNLY